MNRLSIVTMCMLMALSVGTVAAQEKKDSMAKDSMAKPMTMQECKDHMAMQKTDAQKKDAAMMKKDQECADMMKKEGAMKKDEPKK